ncbi:MAG: hypothetical protein IT270_17720 [Saprospiraceae bacterium]|nr:hypothetical protein [Saprospiraceae bacterium]
MKTSLLTLILFLWTIHVYGQSVHLAYFGETITHYGLRGGVEFNLAQSSKTKTNGSTVSNKLIGDFSLTLYRHPQNHLGIILTPSLGWRRTGGKGGMVQAALSPGLFRSFYEAETYTTTSNNSLEKVPLAGRWAFMPGISVGTGHDLSVRRNINLSWFVNLHYLRQYPYNTSYLNRIGLEVGFAKKIIRS